MEMMWRFGMLHFRGAGGRIFLLLEWSFDVMISTGKFSACNKYVVLLIATLRFSITNVGSRVHT